MEKKELIKLISDIINKLTNKCTYRDETDLVASLLKANGEARGMLIWLRKEIEKCTLIS